MKCDNGAIKEELGRVVGNDGGLDCRLHRTHTFPLPGPDAGTAGYRPDGLVPSLAFFLVGPLPKVSGKIRLFSMRHVWRWRPVFCHQAVGFHDPAFGIE